MILSPDQIKLVTAYVDRHDLQIITLKEDLIDHLCCMVENKMASGKSFEKALQESASELAPDGLELIEEETIELLNSNSMIAKKLMYGIGLITSISMTMGLTFKILHMPGADELFNYGFLAFALIFLPLATYSNYFRKKQRTLIEKLRILLGFISAVLIGLCAFCLDS
jgi:hypothetical protein